MALQRAAYRARGFGDFWQHMLVAEGAIDLAVDAVGLAPYDLAAVMVVVEEAGGTFTDRNGVRSWEHDTWRSAPTACSTARPSRLRRLTRLDRHDAGPPPAIRTFCSVLRPSRLTRRPQTRLAWRG